MSFIKFGYGVFALAFSRAALIGLRLLFIYLIANHLDKSVFASLVLCLTVLEIIRYIVDWGSDTYSLRQFSTSDSRQSNATFKWMMTRQRPISSVIGYLISLAATMAICPKLGVLNTLVISMLTVTSLWYTTLTNWLQAHKQLTDFYKHALPICVVAICALIISVRFGLTLTMLVLLTSEVSLIALAAFKSRSSYYASNKNLGQVFTLSMAKKFLYNSTPIAISTMIGLAYTRFDQFYLSTSQHVHEFANYSLALKLADPITFACSAVAITIFSRVCNITSSDTNKINLKRQVKLFVSGGVLLSLVMSIAYIVVCTVLAQHVYITFDLLGRISAIMAALLFIRCNNLILTAIIQGCGFFKEIMYLTMLNLFMTIILIPLGYSMYQLTGLLVAIVIIEFINCCIQLYIIKHKVNSII